MSRALPGSGGLVCAGVLGGCLALIPLQAHGSGSAAAGAELLSHVSKDGGFTVEIPRSWKAEEVPPVRGQCLYMGTFASHADQSYSLRVVRLTDYRRGFSFKASEPEEMILEYAQRFARSDGGTAGSVAAKPTSSHQGGMSLFHIVVGGGTQDCTERWVMVKLEGKSWFDALWEVPCADDPELDEAVARMIGSLEVDPVWRCDRKGRRGSKRRP